MGSHSYHPELWPDDDHLDGLARGLGLGLALLLGLIGVLLGLVAVGALAWLWWVSR